MIPFICTLFTACLSITGKDKSFERFPSIRCGGLALLLVGPWRPDCEVAEPNTDEGGSA